MKLSDLNPHIRYASRHYYRAFDNKKLFSICYDCRLFFLENAKGYVVANGEKYDISNGSVLYFPPLTKYRFHFTKAKDFGMTVLDFDLINDFSYMEDSLNTATEDVFVSDKAPVYPINEALANPIAKVLLQIKPSLRQCCEYFLLKNELYRESSSALLKLCLLELIRNSSKKSSYSELCKNVSDYLYNNYANRELTNSAIAEAFGYHPYHLNHIMKEATGKSLHRHLTDTRMNVAKNYLLTTPYSVEEISWKCGFSSTSYFIKTFKARTDMTPKKYRQLRFHADL